ARPKPQLLSNHPAAPHRAGPSTNRITAMEKRGPKKQFDTRKIVSITAEQDRAIEAAAAVENLAASDIIRRAITAYFKGQAIEISVPYPRPPPPGWRQITLAASAATVKFLGLWRCMKRDAPPVGAGGPGCKIRCARRDHDPRVGHRRGGGRLDM